MLSASPSLSDCVVMIPARYGATRLPGKPLLMLAGSPLLAWVLRRCRDAWGESQAVIVATDDARIATLAEIEGARAVMTSPNCPNGTTRIFEALQTLEAKGETVPEIILHIQGDEPLLTPDHLRTLKNLITTPGVRCATLAAPLKDVRQIADPNTVKVTLSETGLATGFYRKLPEPHDGTVWGHIGVYAWKKELLTRYLQWPTSPGERAQSLEQLRLLENGEQIHIGRVSDFPQGVNSPEDREQVEKILNEQRKV